MKKITLFISSITCLILLSLSLNSCSSSDTPEPIVIRDTIYIKDTVHHTDTVCTRECFDAAACYPFDGNANDISGNSFNGTTHGVTLATGRKGDTNSSYYFGGYKSGNPDYIDLPTLQSINNTEEISISMWLKVDASVPSGNTPFSMLPDSPSDRLNAHINYSPYSVYWDNGSISGNGRVYTNVTNTYTWDHYVFIKSASLNKMKVYKNNTLIIDQNKYDNIENKNKKIRLGGGSGVNSDQYFAGWMDDVKIFRKALSTSEVSDLYNE